MPVPSTTLIASTGTVSPSAARTSSTCAGRVRAEVGLGQDDERLRLGVGGERQEALEPAHVEVAVERPDDEREVDVGGEHLRLGAAVAGRAGDPAPARQQRVHDAGLRVGRDPVADRRQVGGGRRRVRHAARTARRAAGRPAPSRSSRPRWTAATRAGIRSGRPSAVKAASRRGVQPRSASGCSDDNSGSPCAKGCRWRAGRRTRMCGAPAALADGRGPGGRPGGDVSRGATEARDAG